MLAIGVLLALAVLISGGGPPTWQVVHAQDTDPAAPRVPVVEDEIVRGDPGRPWVSLVFNAGAGFNPAPAILDTLAEYGVRTTFFPMGWWAEREPELVARIAAEGHEVASHGHEIFDLTRASDADVIGDLNRADAVIAGITGRSTRPLWSPSAGYRDVRVRRLAASIGYRPIYWTLDSGDWTTDATGAGVRSRVLGNTSNGAIIVMHFDSSRTADSVAAELPAIIKGLREQGYRLVTVTELVTGTLTVNAD
jgi:peptidoglycan/xylan/chitin deacetylase (PgdA/CDA1 family)